MRPGAKLAPLLGLGGDAGDLAEGYIEHRHRRSRPVPGIDRRDDAVPRHGGPLDGDGRRDGRDAVLGRGHAATASPAVTLRSVGAAGGQAAAFIYDLARSVVYTRQGNPAWAGQERDRQPGRSAPVDLFFGAAAFDPQPDWVDRDKVAIPQADEQQRLLANLMTQMNLDRTPLPRFWYLPRGEQAAVVMTGDDHAQRRHRAASSSSSRRRARPAARWPTGSASARRPTSSPDAPLTDAEARALRAVRVRDRRCTSTTDCSDFTPASLDATSTTQLDAVRTPSGRACRRRARNRTHCVAWSDWAA